MLLFLVDHDICENPDSYFGSESGEQVIPVTFSLSLNEIKPLLIPKVRILNFDDSFNQSECF